MPELIFVVSLIFAFAKTSVLLNRLGLGFSNKMNIGILGAGRLGRSLARLLTCKGHTVMLGSRDASRARTVAQLFGSAIKGGSYAQAFAFSDVIMLATLWKDTPRIIKPAGSWENKILIDCSNPETLDGRELLLGHNTSGAEEIAKLATGARVVKAFNYVYAEVLDEGPVFGQEQASVFYCGDDGSAKHILADLIRSCGFDGIDAGPLKSARYLEPIAMLMVQLVRVEGHSPSTVALKLLRREIQICEHGSLNR